MYPHLLKTEAWLINVISQIRSLINDRYLLSEDYAPKYESRCKSLLQDLSLYRDLEVVNALDDELKIGQFDGVNTPLLNKYIRRVASKFDELWVTGEKFIDACNEVILEHSMFRESIAVCAEIDTEDLPFRPNEQHLNYERKHHDLYYDISEIRDFFYSVQYKDEFDESQKLDSVLYSYDDSVDRSKKNAYVAWDDEQDDIIASRSQPEPRFKWVGKKQELAELVWAIWKSERLIDSKTGRPATQKEVQLYFESIFNHSINVMGLLSGVQRTDKGNDGVTFTAHLSDLVIEHFSNKEDRSPTKKKRS